jgi:biotin carboxylase
MTVAKRVLLLSPHESYRIVPYLDAARRLGLALTVGSAGEYSLVSACARGLHLPMDDTDAALAAIARDHRQQPFCAVIGTDDATVTLASLAAARLGLPHNAPRAAQYSRRKDQARAVLARAGLPVPRHWLLDSRQPLASQIAGIVYPCVVKPVALSASRGVIRANTTQELLTACERILAITHTLADADERSLLLVEQYVDGPEYAVEGLLHDGILELLLVFDKPDAMEGPYFEETYYITPSHLSSTQQEHLRQLIEQACRAYGLNTGPVHAEVRVNDAGSWLLEVASRTIGGECARLLRLGTGYGLEELVLAQATGRSLPRQSLTQAAGVLMIPIPGRGILRRVEGLSAAQKTAGIEEVLISFRDGHELVPLPEAAGYLGFIFARGETAREVESALRRAHACLNVVLAPVFRIEDRRTG